MNEGRKNLRSLILACYPSISAFANDVGISRNAMYDFLNGKYQLRIKHFMKMCELLPLDVWALYAYIDD